MEMKNMMSKRISCEKTESGEILVLVVFSDRAITYSIIRAPFLCFIK